MDTLSEKTTPFYKGVYSKRKEFIPKKNKFELQWLEHLWENGKFILDMGSSSHWGLIIAPGQEADGENSEDVCFWASVK